MPEEQLNVNRLWVHYGNGEWVKDISERDLGKQYAHAPEYKDKLPMIVTAVEHGGWSMSYYYDADKYKDGICVGTANDMAQFDYESKKLQARLFNRTETHIGDLRRPAKG
jgi:hypothetical protein